MKDFWSRCAWVLVGALTLVRLAITAKTGISDTEAYYVGWARWPDLSYYDHPPLVAWTTWLVSRVATSAFAVRLVPVACAAAFGLLVFRLARRFFTPRASFFALMLVSALPAFMMTSVLVNPEGLLAPLWVLIIGAIYDLRERREWWRPIVLGSLIGLAFLAKYTAVLAVPLALAWVISERPARKWLTRPAFYAGGGVALLLASPVIAWNAARGFPSVRLHLVERVARPSVATYAANALHTLTSQLGLFHPLVFPALVVAAIVVVQRRVDVRYRFLAWVGLPTLAFFVVMMVRVTDAEPHWTMVAYVPLAIALGALLDESFARWRTYVVAVAISSSLALGVYVVHIASPVLLGLIPSSVYDASADPINETLGWDRITPAVARAADKLGPRAVVVSNHNVLCGHLEVALGDAPNVYCASERRTEFDFVGRGVVPRDAPVVYVETARYPRAPSEVLGSRECAIAEEVDVTRAGRVVQRVRIWSCATARADDTRQAAR
jgi:4-amino-4-deoxy-L-arabinose transferase-like glycosyltransferase